MNFLNKIKFPALAGILFVLAITSCEQELTTIGDGVIGGEPFITDKAVYDVFAVNKKIEAVQTNALPLYQLGVFNDPVYGNTEAQITSQVQLTAYNPEFGDFSQSEEVSGENNGIPENEVIDSVFIYIPYLNNKIDTDSDGVVDALDELPFDGTNDTDGDGVANNVEVANNTNPNDVDTDGDGINDNEDESTLGDRFPETFKIDSIYGDRTLPFNFKVSRSTFFLRDLDPNSNFQEAQEFFSNQQFSPTFTEEVFYDGQVTFDDREILFVVLEDDPDTEENEIGTISSKLDPGIRVKLNATANAFFQENILNKEGGSELLSSSNFKEFFRGIHLSVLPSSNDFMMLLDLTDARMDIFYSYDKENDDDEIERAQKTLEVRLITQAGTNPITGNAINTLINEDYPATIMDRINGEENTDRIYLKGGAGSYAELELFDEMPSEAETIINQIKANNWIINEANLVFYIDTEAVPVDADEPPRLYMYNTETNTPLYNPRTENNIADTSLGVFQNYDGIIEKSGDRGLKYTVKITEYINDIIVRDSANATLGLTISPDIRITGDNNMMLSNGVEMELPAAPVISPLGTVLIGNNVLPSNEDKKLKLEIFYTEVD